MSRKKYLHTFYKSFDKTKSKREIDNDLKEIYRRMS